MFRDRNQFWPLSENLNYIKNSNQSKISILKNKKIRSAKTKLIEINVIIKARENIS